MRHTARIGLVAFTAIMSLFGLAPNAHAATETCETGYVRTSGSTYSTDEQGYGYGWCSPDAVSRIDVQLTYVYCATSTSCNSTGSNFGATEFNSIWADADGAIYNLHGWYKVIVRTSFTLYSGQTFYGVRGENMVYPTNGCGLSGTNKYSCAFESATFYRGA